MAKPTKKRVIKIILAIFLGIVSLSVWYSGFCMVRHKDKIVSFGVREQLVDVAIEAASKIDSLEYEKIFTDPKGQNSSAYQKIKSSLQEVMKAHPEIFDIYTMDKTDDENVWKFGVDIQEAKDLNGDGIISDNEKGAEIGEEYDAAPYPALKHAVYGASADEKPMKDKWGYWISGYAPIFSPDGTAKSIVGVDMAAKIFEEKESTWFYWGIFLMIIGTLMFFGTDHFTKHFYLFKQD